MGLGDSLRQRHVHCTTLPVERCRLASSFVSFTLYSCAHDRLAHNDDILYDDMTGCVCKHKVNCRMLSFSRIKVFLHTLTVGMGLMHIMMLI